MSVDLPVSDLFAVGTPAKTIAAIEFLFVNPVKSSVDHFIRAIAREPGERTTLHGFDIEVVVAHIPNMSSIGRELGEHESRGFGIATEFVELAGGSLENPVIAASVSTPDFHGISVNQYIIEILGEFVAIDAERLFGVGNNEPFR